MFESFNKGFGFILGITAGLVVSEELLKVYKETTKKAEYKKKRESEYVWPTT